MEIKPLTAGELKRLEELNANSSKAEFNWIKARIRSLSSALKNAEQDLNMIDQKPKVIFQTKTIGKSK